MGFWVPRRLRPMMRRSDRPADPPEGGPPRPPEGEPAQPPVPAAPKAVVPRWVQLVVLPLAILGLWALARAAGPVLLILIAASTLALILNPLVKMLSRRRVPRGLAILLVYVVGFAAVGGVGVLLSNPVSTQVSHFSRDVPRFIRRANHDLASFQRWLNRHGVKVQVQHQGETALQALERNV